MNFEDLKNPELQEKLKACKTPEELFALAKEEGLELSDEQLESLSGGRHAWIGACYVHCFQDWPAADGK